MIRTVSFYLLYYGSNINNGGQLMITWHTYTRTQVLQHLRRKYLQLYLKTYLYIARDDKMHDNFRNTYASLIMYETPKAFKGVEFGWTKNLTFGNLLLIEIKKSHIFSITPSYELQVWNVFDSKGIQEHVYLWLIIDHNQANTVRYILGTVKAGAKCAIALHVNEWTNLLFEIKVYRVTLFQTKSQLHSEKSNKVPLTHGIHHPVSSNSFVACLWATFPISKQ